MEQSPTLGGSIPPSQETVQLSNEVTATPYPSGKWPYHEPRFKGVEMLGASVSFLVIGIGVLHSIVKIKYEFLNWRIIENDFESLIYSDWFTWVALIWGVFLGSAIVAMGTIFIKTEPIILFVREIRGLSYNDIFSSKFERILISIPYVLVCLYAFIYGFLQYLIICKAGTVSDVIICFVAFAAAFSVFCLLFTWMIFNSVHLLRNALASIYGMGVFFILVLPCLVFGSAYILDKRNTADIETKIVKNVVDICKEVTVKDAPNLTSISKVDMQKFIASCDVRVKNHQERQFEKYRKLIQK